MKNKSEKVLNIRKGLLNLLGSFTLIAGLSGCATIINGTTQDVSFATKPEGATVKTGDNIVCQTPCKLTLKRKNDHSVLISKEGYEEATITIQHVVSAAVAGNILAGGLIGWGVDAVSGGQYRLVPEAVNMELKPIKLTERPGLFIEKIKELEAMKNSGMLSDEEYQSMKDKLAKEFKEKQY